MTMTMTQQLSSSSLDWIHLDGSADNNFVGELAYRDGWSLPYNYTTITGKSLILQHDTLLPPILAWIFVLGYTIVLPILLALVIWRRNYQPIKARSYLLMILSLASQYITFVVMALRILTGRWRYPCLLFSIVFTLAAPFFFLPTIFRMWRIFFLYRMSHMKTRFVRLKRKQRELARKSINADTMTMTATTTTSVTSGGSSARDHVEMENMGSYNSYSQQHHNHHHHHNDTKSTSASARESSAEATALSMSQQNGWFSCQKIFISNRFLLLVLSVIVVCHFVLWIASLFASYHTVDGLKSLFSFRSCFSGMIWTIMLGVQIAFYTLIQAILLSMLYIFRINDRWKVRLEVTLSIVVISIGFGTTLVLILFGDFFYLEADRYFPAIYFGFFALIIDLAWSVVWPIVQSFFPDNNLQETNESDSLLLEVLEDDAFRELYKHFCAASLVVEPVCFYEDYCEFSDVAIINNRRLVSDAHYLIEKYCRDDSPLQLNLPNRDSLLEPIMNKIHGYEQKLQQLAAAATAVETATSTETATETADNRETSVNERWVDPLLFHSIYLTCISDMNNDTFVRFKKTKEYQSYLKEKRALEQKQDEFGV